LAILSDESYETLTVLNNYVFSLKLVVKALNDDFVSGLLTLICRSGDLLLAYRVVWASVLIPARLNVKFC
jgi:hypothetical protein